MKKKLKIMLSKLLKKYLSGKKGQKIISLIYKIWCFACKLLPLKNRVLFYTIRADGKLLDNARAVYDALDAPKIIFAHMLPHSHSLSLKALFYILTSKVIVTDDYLKYSRFTRFRKR